MNRFPARPKGSASTLDTHFQQVLVTQVDPVISSEPQRNQLIAGKLSVCGDARGPLHWQGLASHSVRWLQFLGRLMITVVLLNISVSVGRCE